LYAVYDTVNGTTHVHKYKENEPCFVEEVKMMGGSKGSGTDSSPAIQSSAGVGESVSLLTGTGSRV